MSRLDDLIAARCPDGVALRPLSTLVTYARGVTYAKSDEELGGPIKVLRSNNITLSSNTVNFDDVKHVSAAVKVRPDQSLRANDILISAASGSKSHVGKVAFIDRDIDFVFGGFMAVVRVDREISPRFLFHLLVGKGFAAYLESTLTSTTINNLTSTTLGNFVVPLPPLEVQAEIVRVLDNFTELEEELEAELAARAQQLAHYQRSLTNSSVPDGSLKPGWVTARIGELCRVEKGKTAIQQAEPGPYPLVATSLERQSSSRYDFDDDAVCIPTVSSKGHGVASISRIFYQSGKFALGTILAAMIPDNPEVLSAEYLYRYLQTRTDTLLVPLMRGGANVSLTVQSLASVPIQVPPIGEQREIARVLGSLSTIVEDQEAGLPAELAARRKQYEYYRDKLLTFVAAPA